MAPSLPLLAALLACLALLGGARGSWSRANTFCHLARAAGGARSRLLSFVWRRPDGAAPVLVQSAWDAQGRLLRCAARVERSLDGAALASSCARRRRGSFGRAFWGPELRGQLEVLEAQKASCEGWPELSAGPAGVQRTPAEGLAGPEAESGPPKKRVRRGFTMPGTVWCGAGDSAGNFSELGVFQGPDVCCREHDQCGGQIPALGYNYGMRNYRFHTVSHCDCDARFRHCLMNLNDTISNLIGVSFFNLLEVPCFVLEESEECLEWHWWGGCKTYGPLPTARLVEQSQYHVLPLGEGPDPALPPPRPGRRRGKGRKHGWKSRKRLGQEATEVQRLHPEPPKVQSSTTPLIPVSKPHLLVPVNPRTTPITRGTAPLRPNIGATTEAGLLKTGVAHATEQPGVQRVPTEEAGQPDETVTERKPFTRIHGHKHTTAPDKQAPSRSCSCYRRLDQCPYRILPYEVKYQLNNADSRTLFHCNCTRRLARFLRKTKGPNEVEGEVLSDYVSSSCFILQSPPGCMEGEEEQPNCIDVGRAILTPARHLTNRLTRKRVGPSLKVKRQERTPASQPLQLFEKCLQLARAARHAVPP
ncbi:group 3 secretory phospholipase A2 [Hemicordylus capensis]|uniref:group 3 secretory phospholipase A2 n=1 Tax=Hemicordylus capensis TaxID=884348 RepID=UPI0023020E1A|nr:group 3 secretory phospholipase A2 [Hemicordylus capensis]